MQLVTDEELAADDEEEDDAGEDIAEGLVEAEVCGDLARAAAEEDQQEARQDHPDGVELGQPGDHDGGEAAAVYDGGGKGVVGAADQQQARQAAERAGEQHRADDDAVDLDADVARGALALADDGDLIAVLGVVEVNVHPDAYQRYDQHVQQVFLPADGREPADLGVLVDDADLAGALRRFPYNAEIGDQLGGDIVHHQGEEGLVGIPLRLEEGGNPGPDCPAGQGWRRSCSRITSQFGRLPPSRIMQAAAASPPTSACPSAPRFQQRMRKAGVTARETQSSMAMFCSRTQTLREVPKEPFKDGGIDKERVFARDQRGDDRRRRRGRSAPRRRGCPRPYTRAGRCVWRYGREGFAVSVIHRASSSQLCHHQADIPLFSRRGPVRSR